MNTYYTNTSLSDLGATYVMSCDRADVITNLYFEAIDKQCYLSWRDVVDVMLIDAGT